MTDSNSDKTMTKAESSGVKQQSKKKQRKESAWRSEEPKDPIAMLSSLPEKKQQEIQRALHLFSLGQGLPRSLQAAKNHKYHFWETQPVPRLGELRRSIPVRAVPVSSPARRTAPESLHQIDFIKSGNMCCYNTDGADDGVMTHGPIMEAEGSVRADPYSLPEGFRWDNLELSSQTVLRELCTLLNENYLEEDDNTVRFDFSPEYLQWALQPPNWSAQWHCGIRVVSSNKLVGFIAAVPAELLVYEAEKRMVQVKFLCVHKKLRLKRMTPVLIRELTRRVNQQGRYQAVYTTVAVLPTPLSSCRYWTRPLNPRKLMEVGHLGQKLNMSLQRAVKVHRLPEVTKTPGLRPATKGDLEEIHSLLQANIRKFHLSTILSLQEVEHWLLPRENVVDTYVVEGLDGTLTGVVSFYSIFSRLLNQPVHTGLRAAHLLCVVSTATNLVDLMKDTLILAKFKGCDIFSAHDVMDNSSFLEQLKFSVDDVGLHYYLYNWMCPKISPNKVGLVLPS